MNFLGKKYENFFNMSGQLKILPIVLNIKCQREAVATCVKSINPLIANITKTCLYNFDP